MLTTHRQSLHSSKLCLCFFKDMLFKMLTSEIVYPV